MNELEEMKKAFDNLTESALQLHEMIKALKKENEILKEQLEYTKDKKFEYMQEYLIEHAGENNE